MASDVKPIVSPGNKVFLTTGQKNMGGITKSVCEEKKGEKKMRFLGS
jgi:hypothetical protein